MSHSNAVNVPRGTHRQHVLLVPVGVAEVGHDENGQEDVGRELEHLQVGAAHVASRSNDDDDDQQ